jgi:hypothetical protein
LNISSVDNDSITFLLTASNGANMGELEGKAYYTGNNAKFTFNDEYDNCIVEFTLLGDSVISVNQKQGVCMAGMGVDYSGQYKNSKLTSKKSKKEENLVKLGMLPDMYKDSIFKSLVGSSYSLFVNTTQLTSEKDDLDSLSAKVMASGVRGLFTSMEDIIMIDSLNNIWAAVIDNSGNEVLYFTNHNDYKDKLPKTIENWRENFKEYKVIFKSE